MTLSALLVGLAGGLSAALLFAAVVGGGALAAPLIMLSPLPIAIAGLGWGSLSGLLAAFSAAAVVASLTHPLAGFVFLLVAAGPTAWYSHQIGLARPTGPADPSGTAPGLEWYPLARVFLWITLLTPVTLVIAGYLVDVGVDETAVALADTLIAMANDAGDTASLPPRDQLIEVTSFYVRLMPISVSVLWLSMIITDLALAARIVRISGRMRRPPEPLARSFGLPVQALLALAFTLVLALSDSAVALPAGAFLGALAIAFALQGFAVIHVKLANHPARVAILAVLYGATFVFSLPLLAALVIGIADTAFDLRKRKTGRPPGT